MILSDGRRCWSIGSLERVWGLPGHLGILWRAQVHLTWVQKAKSWFLEPSLAFQTEVIFAQNLNVFHN